ncbi:hypothetical protein [Microlunatus ginsengisoli]|uniref:hypothetical protein n=1 Tax=Microlunatus ginsengisoli TaxID=363863 RepID=UPI0031D0E559
MIALDLSFPQTLVVTVVGALVTALAAVAAGYVAANSLRQKRKDADEAATARQAALSRDFGIRSELAERTAVCAATMYINCQDAGRHLRTTAFRRSRILGRLDEAYRRFSVDSRALETLLELRFGTAALRPEQSSTAGGGAVVMYWHQVRDLLTLYYFNLRGGYPGRVLEGNSIDDDGAFHAGFDAVAFGATTERGLAEMRAKIRKEYDAALVNFVGALRADPILNR